MDLEVFWHAPVELYEGNGDGLPYYVDLEDIPERPGVYVFGRRFGDNVEPIYIGKADNLRRRVHQHLKGSVQLMNKLLNAKSGARVVLLGEWLSRPGQQADVVLPAIERMLIKFALAEGYELINRRGTRIDVHNVSMTGNRMACKRLFRSQMKVER